MSGMLEAGARLLRLLARSDEDRPSVGTAVVEMGGAAVATLETMVGEVAALGASGAAEVFTRAWEEERRQRPLNTGGAPLTGLDAAAARGVLGSAVGASMGGSRATAFLAGTDLAALYDLLVLASARQAPLVAHVVNCSLAAHGAVKGSGHESWHGVADAGQVMLHARNVQEAVDLALLGRRLAETLLRPVLVAMDQEQTADVHQDVLMPGPDLVNRWLGDPGDQIESPTEAQRLVFGPTRRRVPRSYDLERPVLTGSNHGRATWALGAMAHRVFSAELVPSFYGKLAEEFAEITGRLHPPLRLRSVRGAEVLLLAMGSAGETLDALVDHLRSRRVPAGALSLTSLRPFPTRELLDAARRAKTLVVLERVDPHFGGSGPLMREVRTALSIGEDNARFGADTHPGMPALGPTERPRLVSAIYGQGGHPLRARDLAALVQDVRQRGRSQVYLGVDFLPEPQGSPKQQAHRDLLRQKWPELATRGLAAPRGEGPDLRPPGSISVLIRRPAEGPAAAWAGTAADLLGAIPGGHLRGRSAETSEGWDRHLEDRVLLTPEPVDPGDGGSVDLAVILSSGADHRSGGLAAVRAGGVVLVVGAGGAEPELHPVLSRRLLDSGARLVGYSCTRPLDQPEGADALLGAFLAAVAETGHQLPVEKRILSTRRRMLAHLPEAEVELRAAAFQGGLHGLVAVGEAAVGMEHGDDHRLPMLLEGLTRTDTTVENLPRFWDQVGLPLRRNPTVRLPPDPYMAAGVVPPLTASFNNLAPLRDALPRWSPTACTGCGRCWAACPDASLGPLVLAPQAILEGALVSLSEEGQPVEALRPHLARLGRRLGRELLDAGGSGGLAPHLDAALSWLREKGGAGQAGELAAAAAPIRDLLRPLQAACTPPFFHQREAMEKGTGELLMIAVDPGTCKACGACAAECPSGSLALVPQELPLLREARGAWSAWERLPDTPGATMAHGAAHPEVGPLAAMLLSRHCLLSMAGGDGAEAGSGQKLVLRLVLGSAEYNLQPRMAEHLRELEALEEALAGGVQEVMAGNLPQDLDEIARRLNAIDSKGADLGELVAGAGEGSVNLDGLQGFVELVNGIRALRWRLSEGPVGFGRARAGVAIAGPVVASWAASFPDNPFHMPVVAAGGDEGIHVARGLCEAQVRAVVDDIRMVRAARDALESPREMPIKFRALARLTWKDLEPAERDLVPPVVVVGEEASLTGRNLAELAALLDSDLPIKVLILADLDLGLSSMPVSREPRELGFGWTGTLGEVGLLALGHRKAYVHQGSLAAPAQLLAGIRGALRHPGPAIIRIHAPSPRRHGFQPHLSLHQARLALQSRAMPVFIFDPAREGVFGSCLDLQGNPSKDASWHNEHGLPVTPVDWARSEARFTHLLRPMGSEEGGPPIHLDDWFDLPLHSRSARVAVMEGEDGHVVVDPALLMVAEERRRTWRTLQELAGVVTPFTRLVKDKVEAELGAAHEARVRELEQRHTAELTALERRLDAELAERVRRGLMNLAGYAPLPQEEGR